MSAGSTIIFGQDGKYSLLAVLIDQRRMMVIDEDPLRFLFYFKALRFIAVVVAICSRVERGFQNDADGCWIPRVATPCFIAIFIEVSGNLKQRTILLV